MSRGITLASTNGFSNSLWNQLGAFDTSTRIPFALCINCLSKPLKSFPLGIGKWEREEEDSKQILVLVLYYVCYKMGNRGGRWRRETYHKYLALKNIFVRTKFKPFFDLVWWYVFGKNCLFTIRSIVSSTFFSNDSNWFSLKMFLYVVIPTGYL